MESISDAKEYLRPFSISGSHEVRGKSVYWSHNPDENDVANCSIEERIRRFLIKTLAWPCWKWYNIIQFWAVKRIAGSKCLLTTTHQPFCINNFNKSYFSYRKECMSRNIYVGPQADESQLGPPGRAYRTGFLEICPKLQLYTIQEFPLRDHAILSGLNWQKVSAIPVFELDSNHIVGVLEFLIHPYQWFWLFDLETQLKEVGLTTYCKGSSSESKDRDKYSDNIIRMIDNMFKEVAKTHPLALGLASAPCSRNGSLGKIAVYQNRRMSDLYAFVENYNDIPRGMGVSGRAFASGKSCFCRDIGNLSLSEYSYAHYARHCGLTYSFATCVQDVNNNFLVLEFFLLPGCYSIEVLSRSLLEKIKEHLWSYKVADEVFPGEELDPQICDSLTHVESLLSFSVTPTCGCDSDTCVECYLENTEAVVDFFFPNKLSFVDKQTSYNMLVLWSHVARERNGVEECIKNAFVLLEVDMVQFWAPRMADRSFLTTIDQPFALQRCEETGSIRKVSCLYRKECMTRKIYVDEEGSNERQLGPAGRAYKNGVVECSPDVRLYTIEEFPLRDHAVLYSFKGVICLPVFKLNGKGPVGVLEMLTRRDVHALGISWERNLIFLTRELKEMGLRIDYVHPLKGESQSHAGITNMFKAISATHPSCFARALIPSQGDYCLTNSNLRSFKVAACIDASMYIFGAAELFMIVGRFPYLEDKYGVAGKALVSRRSCFCMNICDLGLDYPLAHYVKYYGFSFSVAICLQNTHCVDKICVLEFFLLPSDYNSKYIRVLLDSLLISVQHHLPPDFKILSEDVPGEPFFLEIGNPSENGSKDTRYGVHVADGRETNSLVPQKNNLGVHVADAQENIYGMHDADRPITQGVNIVGTHVVDGSEATPLVIQGDNIPVMHVIDGSEATPLVPEGENIPMINVVGGTGLISERENICRTESSKRQLEGNRFHISRRELEQHFGKPLDRVAEQLGVSRSTLKRIRKSYGIPRWPSHKKNKANQSLYMNRAPYVGEDIMAGPSRTDIARPVLLNQTSTLSTRDILIDHHQIVHEVAEFVTIKASHGNDVLLKFQLNIRSSLKDLQNEVAQRLKVEAGRCNMKYEDEEGDRVSITIDKDLEDCLQSIQARGQTIIRMSVHIN